ncbi:hypothetical protein [Oceanicola sp. S124]|uniref:hypothetical protein n=1 Tax=Oceanicola sp. S124 TaxID=1042378 RepID=UPI0002559EFC|nr:hypothetical protein [Oceanicola sp. S124]
MVGRDETFLKTRAWVAGMQARHSPEVDLRLLEDLRCSAEALDETSTLRALILDFRQALQVAGRDAAQRAAAGKALTDGIHHLTLAEVGENARRISGD